MEWYYVCWLWLTAKRVEPVVSISWASCFLYCAVVLCSCVVLGSTGKSGVTGNVDVKKFDSQCPTFFQDRECSNCNCFVLYPENLAWDARSQTNKRNRSLDQSINLLFCIANKITLPIGCCVLYPDFWDLLHMPICRSQKSGGTRSPSSWDRDHAWPSRNTPLSHRHGTVPNVVTSGQTVWGQV